MATKLDLTSGVVWVLNAINLNVATLTTTRAGIATTSTDGLVLTNTTASTAGVPVQQSPRIRLRSNVWNTTVVAANNTDDWIIESVPVSGTTPSGLLKFGSSLNGGAYEYLVTITSGGTITANGTFASATEGFKAANTGFIYWNTRSAFGSPADGQISLLNNAQASGVGVDINTDAVIKFRTRAQTGDATVQALGYRMAAAAAATSSDKIIKKVTAIADNTATTVLTITVPNANHAAAVKLTFLSSNGSTDAFESSRVATGHVVIARTTGVATAATAATIDDAAIATVGGGATHTLAYSVVLTGEGAGATETVLVKVTIDDSGNLGSNQVVVLAELINAEATGITIA